MWTDNSLLSASVDRIPLEAWSLWYCNGPVKYKSTDVCYNLETRTHSNMLSNHTCTLSVQSTIIICLVTCLSLFIWDDCLRLLQDQVENRL